MVSPTLERCQALRERHYPRNQWPGIMYEAAVTSGFDGTGVLLEIGCSREGKRLRRMAQHFAHGIGIDMEIAHQWPSEDQTTMILGDGHKLCLQDESVDVVCMANVAEHLEHPAVAFRECARVLKTGGRLVVMTVNQNFPPIAAARVMPHGMRQLINRIASGTADEDTFPAYYRANTLTSLTSEARAAGFEAVDVRYIQHHPHYLMFSTAAYRLGVLFEKMTRPVAPLRHMILGVFEKPAAPTNGNGGATR